MIHSVCLIIDSETPYSKHYERQRKLWKQYMNLDPEIKCYFIRFKPDLFKDIYVDDENNAIYFKGPENYIPAILLKTIKAMEYVYNNFDFKYLIRTNISSFWDFKTYKKVFHTYTDNLVKAPIGFEYNIPFPGGSGMVISKNIIDLMIKNKRSFNYHLMDDRAIGIFLHEHNIPITNGECDRTVYEGPLEKSVILSQINADFNNKYTFRIKYDRGNQDNFIGNTLLRLIYPKC
jgi:hypothetical protein